jgi:hypothetical protein
MMKRPLRVPGLLHGDSKQNIDLFSFKGEKN